MANASSFSVGLAHEVCVGAASAGFEPRDLKALAGSPELLSRILHMVRGEGDEVERRNDGHVVINFAVDPATPDGYTITHHERNRAWRFDPREIALFVSNRQKASICGNELKHELSGKSAFNANLLDYFLACPDRIPQEWKRKQHGRPLTIFFWGTIYRNMTGGEFVRCLCWANGGWHSDFRWLGYNWDASAPAAIRVS